MQERLSINLCHLAVFDAISKFVGSTHHAAELHFF
jgi:hypothetical protein